MNKLPLGYGDETTTGALRSAYRGLRRVTISARIDDPEGFEWLRRFQESYLPRNVEPKSTIVIEIINRVPRAKHELYTAISRATVVVLDFVKFLEEIVEVFADASHIDIRDMGDPLDIIAKRLIPKEAAEAALRYARQAALDETVVARIEWLLLDAAERAGIPIQSGIIDRNALREMGDTEFRELIGRFSVSVGEALHPDGLKRVIEHRLAEGRYLDPGRVATESIALSLERDYVFDQGRRRAMEELEASRAAIENILNAIAFAELGQGSRGAVSEEDSTRIRGLQAADIAAGVARDEFEHASGDSAERAQALRRIFDRVLLNDQWLR